MKYGLLSLWPLWAGCLINRPLYEQKGEEIDACAKTEVCNGVDDDCDSAIDEADADFDPSSAFDWFADEDGDGFGDPLTAVHQCEPPEGYVEDPSDCDDFDAEVSPANEDGDLPYDGVDSNCDGLNDFDADGDCFMPPGFEQLFTQYVRFYFGTGAPPFCVDTDAPFSDCLDAPDPGILRYPEALPVDPADIHPSTPAHPSDDPPYDAVDSDCAADNDFDVDRDGFLPDQPEVLDYLQIYVEAWGYEDRLSDWVADNPSAGLTVPAEGDCDDEDATRWPDALELLGDGVDQDCRSDGDATPFAFGNEDGPLRFHGATNPEVSRLGDTFLVLLAAGQGNIPSGSEEYGLALTFDGDPRSGAVPDSALLWMSPLSTLPVQSLLDVALDPAPTDTDGDGLVDPSLWVGINRDSSIISYTYLSATRLQLLTTTNTLLTAGISTAVVPELYEGRGLDLTVSDGEPIVLACALDRLHALHGTTPPPASLDLATTGASACFFRSVPSLVGGETQVGFSLCSEGSCEDWTLSSDLSTLALDPVGPTADTWVRAEQDEGWESLIDGDGAGHTAQLGLAPTALPFAGVVTSLDVAMSGGTVYAAAVVENGQDRTLWLAYGPLGSLELLELPYDDPTLAGERLEAVAVYADASRVVLAATASTQDEEVLGWVFLGP